MKSILLTLITALVFFDLSAQTIYPTGISNCIARWNFSSSGSSISTINDVSGNNNNGTAFNVLSANGFRNIPGSAMKFNGINSYAQVSNNALLQPASITMLALVNLDSFYFDLCQNTAILSKGTSSFASGVYALDINDNIWDNNNCYSYNPNAMQMSASLAGAPYTPNTGSYIALHKWYLLACSYDGNIVKYYQLPMDTSNYINNVSTIYMSGSLNHPLGTNSSDLMIGKLNNSLYPYWLNGRLDEVALFNRVLNTSEVHDIYDYLWGKVVINKPFTDTVVCAGGAVNISYSVSDNFAVGNVFTVQLSSASGSFVNPTPIGTATSNVSGTISCTIPSNTPPGVGYRVRIVPSNPSLTSRDNGKNIQITPALTPSVLISASPNNVVTGQPITFTAFVNNGGTNINYQWKKNGIAIPGATSNPYTTLNISGKDNITVTVKSGSSCVYPDTVTSNVITLIATSVDHINSFIYSTKIYPNPSNGIFSVNGELHHSEQLRFQLLNSLGQSIRDETINYSAGPFKKVYEVNKEVTNGVYILRVSNSQRTFITPITIKQ